jgi:hypothetical protein
MPATAETITHGSKKEGGRVAAALLSTANHADLPAIRSCRRRVRGAVSLTS